MRNLLLIELILDLMFRELSVAISKHQCVPCASVGVVVASALGVGFGLSPIANRQ